MWIKVFVASAALSSPALAEVKSATEAGFEVGAIVTVAASPDRAYAALIAPAKWWNAAHSYSGDAANLSIEPRAGGCFCEKLKDGGAVQHLRVVYVEPGRMLRLHGGLGPLQGEAAAGTLTWTIAAAPAGGATITQSYVVGGYIRGGAAKLAAPVDAVLAEQLSRLKAHLDKS